MTPEPGLDYCIRGHRVPFLKPIEIIDMAHRVCSVLKIRRHSFSSRNAEKFVARLEEYGIYVDVIEDGDWIDATRATVDPQKLMIYVPNKLYADFCRGQAEAVRIFLHELGHIMLGHRPLLHFSESTALPNEDSEWQADFFADSILDLLGLPKAETQLELKF